MSGDAAMTESEETVLFIEHRYVCSECGVEYPNLEDAVVHQQSHTGGSQDAEYQVLDLGSHENQYQCLECGQLLMTPSDLLAHQELHIRLLQNPPKPEKIKRPSRNEIHYECQECKALFNSQDLWLAHRYTHMEPQNVPQSKVVLQTEGHVVEDSIQLMCDPSTPGEVHLVAGQQHFHVPTSSSDAVSHTQVLVDMEHSYKKSDDVAEECAVEVLFYKCSECTQLFQSPGDFLEHQATHFQGQENAVEVSGQSGEAAQPLANEQIVEQLVKETAPSDRPGQVSGGVLAPPVGEQVAALNDVTRSCAICKASFKSERELKAHLICHKTGPFNCPLCSKVFLTHQDVEEHLKSHQSEHHYLCVECGLGFASESVLVNHRRTHQSNPLYSCECGQTFVNMTKFLYHRRMHSTKTQEPVQEEEKKSDCTSPTSAGGGYVCSTCGKAFPLMSQLLRHQRFVHAMEKRHKCPTCSKPFKKRSHLRNHMLTHTGERPYSCSVCSKSFNAQANLLRHKLTHTGEKPHKCQLCGKAFSQSSTLQQHLVVHSQTYPYKCTECGVSFHRPYRLLMHQYHHTGEYPYKCQVCGLSFLLKRLLEVHEIGHRGEEPFRCADCGANYPSSQRLKDHRCNRTGAGPGDKLECPICGKKVNSDAGLNAHVSTQHVGARSGAGYSGKSKQPLPARNKPKVGSRSLECPECHKTFSTETSLQVHRRIHTGERPYPCQICGKAFRQSTHLKDHVRLHTGEKPFKCDVCGKAFTIAVRLAEHKRIHTGERPHTCPECGRAYRSFSNLWKHRKLHREQAIPMEDHEAHAADLSSAVAIVETVETIPIIETVEIFPEGSSINVQDIQFETLQVENIHLGNIQIGTL